VSRNMSAGNIDSSRLLAAYPLIVVSLIRIEKACFSCDRTLIIVPSERVFFLYCRAGVTLVPSTPPDVYGFFFTAPVGPCPSDHPCCSRSKVLSGSASVTSTGQLFR